MTELLSVRNLHGGYGRAPVLRDIGFSVGADQIVGVFGANGAGKTTLLRALSGTLPVVRGEITLNGRSAAPTESVGAGQSRAEPRP